MSLRQVDLAISASWIIPVVPKGRTLEDCTLVVNDGKIVDIIPQKEFENRYEASIHRKLEGHALIPGLINAHGHAAMSLLRGFADDTPLQTWLEEHIWPTEQRFVDEEFVRDGTELAIAEMLLSGTSCFADMYFFPEAAAEVAHKCGIRAQIAFPIFNFPSAWGSGPDEYIEKGLKLRDTYRSHDRVRIAFGPHAPYTVDDATFSKVATLAEELQAPIHVHLHETAFEVDSAVSESGLRPIERLNELGVLSPLTQCVHMTQMSDSDIDLIKRTGAHVIHCPDSNLKLASGLCPVDALKNAEINVAIGTDGAASNNDLNMFDELKQTALVGKITANNAAAVSAEDVLLMATLGGAKALGIDAHTGSLEPGKAADVCAVDMSALSLQPIYNPLSQLVYANTHTHVSHLWVAGKALVEGGELCTLSSKTLLEKAKRWKNTISS